MAHCEIFQPTKLCIIDHLHITHLSRCAQQAKLVQQNRERDVAMWRDAGDFNFGFVLPHRLFINAVSLAFTRFLSSSCSVSGVVLNES